MTNYIRIKKEKTTPNNNKIKLLNGIMYIETKEYIKYEKKY